MINFAFLYAAKICCAAKLKHCKKMLHLNYTFEEDQTAAIVGTILSTLNWMGVITSSAFLYATKIYSAAKRKNCEKMLRLNYTFEEGQTIAITAIIFSTLNWMGVITSSAFLYAAKIFHAAKCKHCENMLRLNYTFEEGQTIAIVGLIFSTLYWMGVIISSAFLYAAKIYSAGKRKNSEKMLRLHYTFEEGQTAAIFGIILCT